MRPKEAISILGLAIFLAVCCRQVASAQANCLDDNAFVGCHDPKLSAEATTICLALEAAGSVHCVLVADTEEYGPILRWSDSPADCSAQLFFEYNVPELVAAQLDQCNEEPCGIVGVPGTQLIGPRPLLATLMDAQLGEVPFELDPLTRFPEISRGNIRMLADRWRDILNDNPGGGLAEVSRGLGRGEAAFDSVAVEGQSEFSRFHVGPEDKTEDPTLLEEEGGLAARDEPTEAPWWRGAVAGPTRRVRVAIVDSGVTAPLLDNLNCTRHLAPRNQRGECRVARGLYSHPLATEAEQLKIVSSYSRLHGAEMLALLEEVVAGQGLEHQVAHLVFRSLEGTGCVADGAIERAFTTALAWGADIILTAWTLNGSDQRVRDAAQRLAASGALFVTSSIADSNQEPQNYKLQGQLLVAPYDSNDAVPALWDEVTIFAPGYDLYSELLEATVGDGSSPAAAVVAGAAAAVLAHLSGSATGQDAGQLLVANAEQRELKIRGRNETKPVLDLRRALHAAQ